MTCIIGLKHKDKVYIASDSQSTSGHVYYTGCKHKKVFRNEDFIFANTGIANVSELMEYSFQVPRIKEKQTIENFIYETFAIAVKDFLSERGIVEISNNVVSFENLFLFSYGKRLFKMTTNLCILEYDDFVASGTGSHFALGSLYTTKNLDMEPEERIELAIDAAGTYDIYCDKNIQMITS